MSIGWSPSTGVQARFGTAARLRLPRPASGRMAAIWLGARIVKPTPSSARIASTDWLTAVSGSHIPVASRPKRWRKSARPHRIWVRTSRSSPSGRIMWFQAWAIAPPPASACWIRAYTSGWWRSSHDISVGPTLNDSSS